MVTVSLTFIWEFHPGNFSDLQLSKQAFVQNIRVLSLWLRETSLDYHIDKCDTSLTKNFGLPRPFDLSVYAARALSSRLLISLAGVLLDRVEARSDEAAKATGTASRLRRILQGHQQVGRGAAQVRSERER